MRYYEEPKKKLPVREFDVVVVGGGTGGVVAAIAAARQGAKTALVEAKGYFGGIIVEGGTALHSFYNLWKPFEGVEKRQIVKGIPQEIIDRLDKVGGTSLHAEMELGYDYDSICTSIDTELYKVVAHEMLKEANVNLFLNTLVTDAIMNESTIEGIIVESRLGREAFMAKSFIDCTGYGDLSSYAGAKFTEPNDHAVANSIGVGGVSLEKFYEFLEENDALTQYAYGKRSGENNKLVRVEGKRLKLPQEIQDAAKEIGFAFVTTSVHDDYFMFIKLNYKMDVSPTNRDAVVEAELELRKRQVKAIELIRKYIKGCEKAYIARTSPSLSVRRGRCIECDYDISVDEIVKGTHFIDDIMTYGFHDCSPRIHIENGKSYGIPYRALLPKGIDNLYATGMMITSDWKAHMSTRNTVSCMGQGQAAGIAAALCVKNNCKTRELSYETLKEELINNNVHLEN